MKITNYFNCKESKAQMLGNILNEKKKEIDDIYYVNAGKGDISATGLAVRIILSETLTFDLILRHPCFHHCQVVS